MTRFARRGTQTTKKPLEASSWAELRKGWEMCSRCHKKGHPQGECPQGRDGSQTSEEPSSEGGAKQKKSRLEMKQQRRREKKKMKRMYRKERSKVCEFCHDIGHHASECPCRISDASSFGSCTACGSMDHATDECKGPSEKCPTGHQEGHTNGDCPEQSSSDEESDSVPEPCPICHELGHEVKGCPDNPRSIYPVGGCCKECGSVEHKTRLCPEKQPIRVEEVTLSTRSFGSLESADAYEEELDPVITSRKTKPHRKKVVVF